VGLSSSKFVLFGTHPYHPSNCRYCKSTNEPLTKSDFEVRATIPRIVHFQLGNKYELLQLA
jgi:glutaredoxin